MTFAIVALAYVAMAIAVSLWIITDDGEPPAPRRSVCPDCSTHGRLGIHPTRNHPSATWICPRCGAWWVTREENR